MAIEKSEVYEQTRRALEELYAVERPGCNPIRLLVVGGSTSEIAGGVIGHQSTGEYGEAVARAALEVCAERGTDVAFQCCEHLNRALVMERAAAEKFGCEPVSVVPRLKAGGALATAAWRQMKDPVAALAVRADAGIDIGLVMIGMHLRRVAIPVRLPTSRVGCAIVAAARTRPMLVGGERAAYE